MRREILTLGRRASRLLPEFRPPELVNIGHFIPSLASMRGEARDLSPFQHLQPGGPGVFPKRRYEVTPYEGETLNWTVPRVKTLG